MHAVVVAAAVTLIGCSAQAPPALPSAPPEAEGFDAQRLDALRASLAERHTDALLVSRHGRIVLEWYAEGLGMDSRLGLASVTKSVVGGMALLLALQDSLVHLDDPASSFVPRWRTDSVKRSITLRQLATHSSGIEDAEESGREHNELSGWKGDFWARNPDPFSIALDEAPVIRTPGSGFVYSNPGYAALGYALTAALDEAGRAADLRELLRARLMRPLGIPDDDWSVGYGRSYEVDGLALVATWGGANFTARAVAQLGQLLLQRGEWGGRRLLEARWIDTVTTYGGVPTAGGQAPAPTPGFYSNFDGRLQGVPRDAFFAVGAGQRVLAVIPSLGIVAVRLGHELGGGFWDGIYRHFLVPLMDAVAEPPYPPSDAIRQVEFAPESTIVRRAIDSDNWPITWMGDGSQFTAYGDGWGFEPRTDIKLSLGFAQINGGPHDFTGRNVRSPSGERTGNGPDGAKASGLLAVDGVLYMWARNLQNAQLAWSEDDGATWRWGFRFDTSFGAPTFLQFGSDYAGARDDFLYVYSHDGPSAYEPADGVVLARVRKGRVREREAYEFFSGRDGQARAVWTRDLSRRSPVLQYPGHALRTDAVYHPRLGRYLLAMALNMEGAWAIFDAPEPWGAWTTAFYTFQWDVARTHGYRLPSKWIGNDGSMYLVFSAHARPTDNYDAFSVRRMVLGTVPDR